MNIKIIHSARNAMDATGLTVVIDVFRAFSVEAYLISQNAQRIIPVGEKEVAYDFKKKNKDIILVGERNGIKLPDFDYGNSPTQIENIDFSGKTIVHTTSAGTQGLIRSINADEIITGSLVNAKAIVKYIKDNRFNDVSLLCTSWQNPDYEEEDTICAKYIKAMLEAKPYDIDSKIEELRHTGGAKFFNEELKDVFPKKDFELCTKLNIFNFVLRYNRIDKEYGQITKIDV